MRFLSGFSGIEAASVAWGPLGWNAAAFMEIAPFPSAVLAHRYPDVPNLGDIAGVGEAEVRCLGPFDLFVFGWPCQDLSVAGKRRGLAGERSGLFYEATRILRLAERHAGCRWFVAENVPGLLSSHGGRDFGEVIRETTGLTIPVPRDGWGNGGVVARNDGGWSIAWRVLDARFFGVPQRRRRVFIVGYLGNRAGPVSVLFERESLCRDSSPGREARQGVAPTLSARTQGGGGLGTDFEINGGLIAHSSSGAGGWREGLGPLRAREQDSHENLIAHTLRGEGFDASEDGTGRGTPLVPVAYQCHGSNVGTMGTIRSGNGNETGGVPFIINAAESCAKASHARESDVARCIDSNGSFATNQGGTVVAVPQSHPLYYSHDYNQDRIYPADGVTPAIMANDSNRSRNHLVGSAVRRLTPLETERLQGFPDGWTLVPYRGKPAADGNRYKAVGNSMAVPCMAWIRRRIQAVEASLTLPNGGAA